MEPVVLGLPLSIFLLNVTNKVPEIIMNIFIFSPVRALHAYSLRFKKDMEDGRKLDLYSNISTQMYDADGHFGQRGASERLSFPCAPSHVTPRLLVILFPPLVWL